MRKLIILTLVFLALSLTACQQGKKTLHVYTWADYIKPELIAEFEQANNCQVTIDTFESNEAMYARVKAGAAGYDIITPSSYMAKIMFDQGMLQKLDHSKLSNLKNVDAEYLKLAIDTGMNYSVPYMITYTGLAWLGEKVEVSDMSWSLLDNTEYRGRMTMLNDMRESIGAALKFLGYSLNTTDEAQLKAAKDVVIRWRRNLAKFESEQYKTGLVSGEFLVAHGFSGDILKVQEENENIEFGLPKEGFSLACDDFVIPTGARETELAHRFVNYLHEAPVAAANTEYIMYLCPNSSAYPLLSQELREDPVLFPPAEVRARGEVIKDLGSENAKYIKVWDEIKAAE